MPNGLRGSGAINSEQGAPCEYTPENPPTDGGGILPPPPPMPPLPGGPVCHTYIMVEDHPGYVVIVGQPWTECDGGGGGGAASTSMVPAAVPILSGSCTPWSTSNSGVATISSAGIVTARGAGATYRIERCGDRLRATPTYVRNPLDAINATNGGCSDGHTYDVVAAAPNQTWWDLGDACLGGGVPVAGNVAPTAAPSALAAIDPSRIAISPTNVGRSPSATIALPTCVRSGSPSPTMSSIPVSRTSTLGL